MPSRPLHHYSEKIRSVNLFLGLAILLLIIVYLAPFQLNDRLAVLVKFSAIGLLLIAATINFQATYKLQNDLPGIFHEEKLQGVRNNALLSYLLCGFFGVLILYILKNIF
jgi:hypothetical protein